MGSINALPSGRVRSHWWHPIGRRDRPPAHASAGCRANRFKLHRPVRNFKQVIGSPALAAPPPILQRVAPIRPSSPTFPADYPQADTFVDYLTMKARYIDVERRQRRRPSRSARRKIRRSSTHLLRPGGAGHVKTRRQLRSGGPSRCPTAGAFRLRPLDRIPPPDAEWTAAPKSHSPSGGCAADAAHALPAPLPAPISATLMPKSGPEWRPGPAGF